MTAKEVALASMMTDDPAAERANLLRLADEEDRSALSHMAIASSAIAAAQKFRARALAIAP